MVDYTRGTGSAGTMIIRDEGGQVSFWLSVSDGATNVGSASWDGRVNGVYVSGTYSWPSGGGTRRIAGPWTVSTTQDVIFFLYGSGTQGIGGPTSFTQRITRALPNTPTGLTATRVSDARQTLNWTRNSPYTSVVIQRTTGTGGSWSGWQQVGVASGNAFSFTDTTTVANRRYVYRVAGRNANGQSGWSGQATIDTTPAAPTGLAAVRSGDDIIVSASARPPYATSFDVEDDGAIIASAVSMPFTHIAPNPAVPHLYRVRGRIGSLLGPWSAVSNTVQLAAPPNAPANLAPNGAVREFGKSTRFEWQHNPVDSSTQTEFGFRYRKSDYPSWITRSGTTAEFLDLIPVDGNANQDLGDFEWQVRTKGAHPDWSPWSAVATVTIIDAPGVAVVQPEDEWDASTLTVEWSWFQAQARPQSAWQVELLNSSLTVVESRSGSGAAMSVTLAYRLTEGDWTVRVRAATGDVWSLWAEELFTVTFDPPAPPVLDGEWDDAQGGVLLTVGSGTPGDAVLDGGVWFAEFER